MTKDDRVMIFIDGSNFYYGLKATFGTAKIDFSKFAELLCNGRPLIRIYYYNTPVDREENEFNYKEQQRFFGELDRVPYLQKRLGTLVKRRVTCKMCHGAYTRKLQKGVDSLLVTDMLKMAYNDNYDTAILVSGDADFACAVEAVKDNGQHVEVASFATLQSYQLYQMCDKSITLNKAYLITTIVQTGIS